jgi:hypothetical protein
MDAGGEYASASVCPRCRTRYCAMCLSCGRTSFRYHLLEAPSGGCAAELTPSHFGDGRVAALGMHGGSWCPQVPLVLPSCVAAEGHVCGVQMPRSPRELETDRGPPAPAQRRWSSPVAELNRVIRMYRGRRERVPPPAAPAPAPRSRGPAPVAPAAAAVTANSDPRRAARKELLAQRRARRARR